MNLEAIYTPTLGRSVQYPLFSSRVSAGFPSPADDFLDGKIDLNHHLVQNPPATFFVRVAGDSMQGAGIFSNDLLVVDRSMTPQDGNVVVASVDGELAVKRLEVHADGLKLLSENPNYPPLWVKSSADLVIWGVVSYVVHKP